MKNESSRLEAETDVYMKKLPSMLREGHEEEFVVIRSGIILGYWSDFQIAFREGSEIARSGKLLVKKVSKDYLPENFGRYGRIEMCLNAA